MKSSPKKVVPATAGARFYTVDPAFGDAGVVEYKKVGDGWQVVKKTEEPISMLLWCPECSSRHVDEGEFATKPHHTHACQSCGHCWRPAVVPTCGVRFLPGFKN